MRNPNARPRYGGSKVRSGCITCKTRHLKCDEKRPFCQRCIKAGRDCGYRDLAAGAGQGPSPDGLRIIHYVAKVPESPSTFPNWTSPEKRSLDFYKSRTSTELAGCMISELWSRCILQVALWQPAVKHAVIALAALHEGFQFHPHAPDTSFAIQQYNRAIRAVSSLELTGKAVDVALLSCMLFVAFESLRGNHKSALRHISGGLGIALAQEAEGRNIYEQHPSWHLLEPVVVFMGDQAMRVCNPPLPHVGISSIRRAPRPLPTAFVSIEEARILIFNHHNEALHYFQNYGEPQHPEEAEQTTQNIRAKEVKIAEYHRFFRRFCTTFDQANFPPSHPEVLILQMYRTVIDLIIGLAAGHDETKWDASHAHFRRIVTLGEAFMLRPDANLEATNAMSSTPPREHQRDDILDRIESSVSGKEFTHTTESPRDTAFENGNVSAIPTRRELQHLPTRPTFTFSHGIITPLNLVCIRCRDPILRRRALRVLQICNRQEGMWDSARFARVADRVIQIEETSAGGAVTDASQIPARARVQELDMFFGPGKHGKIAYTMSTPGPSVRTVEYLDGGTRGLSVDEGEEDVECRSFLYHMSSSRSLRTQGPVSMDRLPRSRRMGALEEACQDGGRVKSFTSAEPFQLREAMSRAENGTSPKGLPYLYPAMRGDAPCL